MRLYGLCSEKEVGHREAMQAPADMWWDGCLQVTAALLLRCNQAREPYQVQVID